jgi:predicted ArsR family transcriptional regulator
VTTPELASLALLHEPARRSLYDWVVVQHRPVGREEAARAVGITRSLATFHLDRLVDGGLLLADYRRLNGRTGPGAGRPARVYWRSPREISVSVPERRYELAARVMVEALEKSARPGGKVREAAREIGQSIGATARGRAGARSSLRSALEANGYEPTEPDAEGVIRLRNCPFHALVEEHRPLVCDMNLALAEGIADAVGVDRRLQPRLDPRPGYCCVAFGPPRGRRTA